MDLNINYDALKFWLSVANTLVLIALFWWNIVVNKTRANKASIDDLSEELGDVKNRVTVLERDVEALPDHDDINVLHKKVSQTNTAVAGMTGELKAMNKTLGLINEHLLRDK